MHILSAHVQHISHYKKIIVVLICFLSFSPHSHGIHMNMPKFNMQNNLNCSCDCAPFSRDIRFIARKCQLPSSFGENYSEEEKDKDGNELLVCTISELSLFFTRFQRLFQKSVNTRYQNIWVPTQCDHTNELKKSNGKTTIRQNMSNLQLRYHISWCGVIRSNQEMIFNWIRPNYDNSTAEKKLYHFIIIRIRYIFRQIFRCLSNWIHHKMRFGQWSMGT